MGNLIVNRIINKTFLRGRIFLLKTVLLWIIFLAFGAVIVNTFNARRYDLVDTFLPCIFLLVLWLLYVLVVKGWLFWPAFFIIGSLSLVSYYLFWNYGTMVPQGWVLLSLTIIMGGILLGSKFSIFLVTTHGIILFLLTYFQIKGIIQYKIWDTTPMMGSVLVAIFTLVIMAFISCLFDREVEKALKKAKKFKNDLKKERDGLEIEVERRTEELKKAQLEKLTIFYRFSNYGRITAGLFHDIANPLTQVSLSLSSIDHQTKNKLLPELKEIEPIVKRAINGTKQMEKFMMMLKKQIQQQEMEKKYKPWDEIKMAIENFEYKARKMKVQMIVTCKKNIYTIGNSLRFYQMISNLISNALDSYHEIQKEDDRKVIIKLDANKNKIKITVEDFGCGMTKEIVKKIFDPWFTTKDPKRGTGFGLYMTKKIVEEELGGEIKVKSKLNEGTLFAVKFPIKTKPDEKKYKPSN